MAFGFAFAAAILLHTHLAAAASTTSATPQPVDSTSTGTAASSTASSSSSGNFEWASVGDSWTSGVAYSASTVYRKTDTEFCYRTNQAWSALMEADTTWVRIIEILLISCCTMF